MPPGTSEEFRIRLQLFDGEGRREVLGNTRDVKLPGVDLASGDWNEVALRLDLQPGRYQLRMAVERRRTQTAGSVHATITIPDFAQTPLSLSGVVDRPRLGPPGRRPRGPRWLVAVCAHGDPRLRPGRSCRSHAAHSSGSPEPARPVVVETEVMDAAGALVQSTVRTIAADAFADGAGVEHRFELPVATLKVGDYLLRFAATAGDARAQRDVRFSVRQLR